MEKKILILINCEESTAKELVENKQELQISEKHHLDGSLTEYIVFGTIALESVNKLLELLIKYLELKKEIKSLQIGQKRLESPTKENIQDSMIELKED